MRGLFYGTLLMGAVAFFVSACGDEDISTLTTEEDGVPSGPAGGPCSAGTTVGSVCGGGMVFTTNYQGVDIILVAQAADFGPLPWKNNTASTLNATDALDGSLNFGTFNANHPAAKVCQDSVAGGVDDWWLPAVNELQHMTEQAALLGLDLGGTYWSSTQASDTTQADAFQYAGGIWNQIAFIKTSSAFGRCVRRPIPVP